MVIADAGFWLALFNSDDQHHGHAVAAFERLREALVTTWPVLAEACYLMAQRLSPEAARRLLERLGMQAFEVHDIAPSDVPRLVQLMADYEDQAMDLGDASLVLLAERLSHGRILTTDRRDFAVYRWGGRNLFQNLLIPD